MTHEELLEAISIQLVHLPPYVLGGPGPYLLALRAVVEIHKPDFVGKCMSPICEIITPQGNDYAKWPCETIQVIEKELQ